MSLNKQSLKSLIFEAFPSEIPIPKLHIFAAEAIDWYLYRTDPEKFEKIKSKSYPMPWPEVPRKHLTDNINSLCYLEPDGILYYLPRIMIDFIDHYSESHGPDFWLHESLIYGFAKIESFALFNEQQLNACTQFILFVSSITTYFSEVPKYLANEWAPRNI